MHDNQFISASNGGGGNIYATASTPKEWEWFTVTRNPDNKNQVHIKSYNGMYLQVKAYSLEMKFIWIQSREFLETMLLHCWSRVMKSNFDM